MYESNILLSAMTCNNHELIFYEIKLSFLQNRAQALTTWSVQNRAIGTSAISRTRVKVLRLIDFHL